MFEQYKYTIIGAVIAVVVIAACFWYIRRESQKLDERAAEIEQRALDLQKQEPKKEEAPKTKPAEPPVKVREDDA
jgi:Flp pilus assembly protein TadB